MTPITKGDPQWQRLYDEYLKNPSAGYVSVGGKDYRILKSTKDEIFFQVVDGMSDSYSSLSL